MGQSVAGQAEEGVDELTPQVAQLVGPGAQLSQTGRRPVRLGAEVLDAAARCPSTAPGRAPAPRRATAARAPRTRRPPIARRAARGRTPCGRPSPASPVSAAPDGPRGSPRRGGTSGARRCGSAWRPSPCVRSVPGTARSTRWTSASLPVLSTPSSVSTAPCSVITQLGRGSGPCSAPSQVDQRSPSGGPSSSTPARSSSVAGSNGPRRFGNSATSTSVRSANVVRSTRVRVVRRSSSSKRRRRLRVGSGKGSSSRNAGSPGCGPRGRSGGRGEDGTAAVHNSDGHSAHLLDPPDTRLDARHTARAPPEPATELPLPVGSTGG